MNHIMIDLETLGQTPGCSILSIGAVAFCPQIGQLGAEFYTVVNRKSCLLIGLTEDKSTLEWWSRQSIEAKKVFGEAEASETSIEKALVDLAFFIRKFGGNVRIWGNGADFDNAILAVCFQKIKQQLPWKFWNNRCFRTLKSFSPDVPMPRSGTYHNALDDAKTQANAAIQMLRQQAIAIGARKTATPGDSSQ